MMTHRVLGTMWMPYEYGRVKDSSLLDLRAAAWFEPGMQPMHAPEYFHLGPKLTTETAIRNWCRAGPARSSTGINTISLARLKAPVFLAFERNPFQHGQRDPMALVVTAFRRK
jgi:hypothetical protein